MHFPKSLLLCILVALSASLVLSTKGPSGFFSAQDKEGVSKTITNLQKKDGSFLGLKNTYYAVNTLLHLKQNVPKQTEVCEFAKTATLVTAEDAFYQASILEGLNCGAFGYDKTKGIVKSALKASDVGELSFGVRTAVLLKKKVETSDQEIKGVIDQLLELAEDDGVFKKTADDPASLLYTGLALKALSTIATSVTLTKDEQEKVEGALSNAGNVISLGESEDGAIYFTDEETKASPIRVTSGVFSGLSSLSTAMKKPVKEITKDTVVEIAETFVRARHSSVLEEINFVVEGLAAVNSYSTRPVVVTLAQKAISPSSSKKEVVKVQVTDIFGNFASKAKVTVVKASAGRDSLASKVDLTVDADTTTYTFDFLSYKPETGLYTLDISVVPEDSHFIGVTGADRTIKVLGTATVSDVVLIVSDSTDPHDYEKDGKKHKPAFPKKLDGEIKTEQNQHVFVKFQVKGASGKPLSVQQALVRVYDSNSGRESFAVAHHSDSGYLAHLNIQEIGRDFYNTPGKYQADVIIGDAFLQNPTVWNMATLSLNFPEDSKLDTPRSPFAPLNAIKHIFRQPDKRPPKTISFAFTIAVLTPFLVLFIGLPLVGARISLPGGSGFLWAVGFQAVLGAILALFMVYWWALNMMQTLSYLAILAVPFLFFANRNLNGLASVKHHSD